MYVPLLALSSCGGDSAETGTATAVEDSDAAIFDLPPTTPTVASTENASTPETNTSEATTPETVPPVDESVPSSRLAAADDRCAMVDALLVNAPDAVEIDTPALIESLASAFPEAADSIAWVLDPGVDGPVTVEELDALRAEGWRRAAEIDHATFAACEVPVVTADFSMAGVCNASQTSADGVTTAICEVSRAGSVPCFVLDSNAGDPAEGNLQYLAVDCDTGGAVANGGEDGWQATADKPNGRSLFQVGVSIQG